MMGIYEIVNLADGKASSYVGSSVNIEKRWREHKCRLQGGQHENSHLQRAWDKYGEDAFVFSVLEEVGEGVLLIMEQEYLDDYFDRGHCYNIATCAEAPARGRSLTEEHKLKLSEAHKGKKQSGEHTRKISEANKGKKRSEEFKRGRSEAMMGNQIAKGHKRTKEHRRKLSEANKGKHPSAEARRKLSESHMGQVPWNKGQTGVYSEETKRKMVAGRKRRAGEKES